MNPQNTFLVNNEFDILKFLKKAKEENKTISCFSTGFNWGYGVNRPIDPNAINLNLSNMNKIKSFDPDLGILKIEPGVTQGQLQTYLHENHFDYYVPNTGAGHRGSILGNALERGFGISPIHDHASSILSVRGILSDGTIYESGLKEIDEKLADCFPWGVGPQLDKMISQSSWIIITEVSIQLKRKNQCTDVLLISFAESEMKDIIPFLQRLMSEDNGQIGSIKIFNKKQVVHGKSNSINEKIHKNIEWFITIIIYSHPITRNSILKFIKSLFKNYSRLPIFSLNDKKIYWAIKFLSLFPQNIFKENINHLNDLNEMIKLAKGETSEVGYTALNKNFDYKQIKQFDLNNFDQNFVWLSPLCPLDLHYVLKLLQFIRNYDCHPSFKFNTLTWTVLNQRTLALVIPIIFEKEKDDNFWIWYRQLHLDLKKVGFIPYRFHVNMMDMVQGELLPNYFRQVNKFERAMDPDNLILMGRYS